MLTVKCIKKFRNDKEQIIGYRLQDTSGNTKDVNPEILKKMIKENKVDVVNLRLTSDNRLINKDEKNVTRTVVEPRKDSVNTVVKPSNNVNRTFRANIIVSWMINDNEIYANDFKSCDQFDEIVLGDNVRFVREYAFAGCLRLKRLVIKSSKIEIADNAFLGCANLKTVQIMNNDAKIKSSRIAFRGCSALNDIRKGNEKAYSVGSESTIKNFSDFTDMMNIVGKDREIGKKLYECAQKNGATFNLNNVNDFIRLNEAMNTGIHYKVSSDGETLISAWADHPVDTVYLPPVKYIADGCFLNGITVNAFWGDLDWGEEDYSIGDDGYGEFIGYRLVDRTSEITNGKWCKRCKNKGYGLQMFKELYKDEIPSWVILEAKRIVIPDTLKDLGKDNSFTRFTHTYERQWIDTLIFGTADLVISSNNSNFKKIDGLLYSKSRNILIGPCITSGSITIHGDIPNCVEGIFANTDIEEVTYAEGVKRTGELTFCGCQKLKKVNFASSIEKLEKYCFMDTGVRSVELPERLKELQGGAFESCKNLETIIMKDSKVDVSNGAFNDCPKLKYFRLSNNMERYMDEDMVGDLNKYHNINPVIEYRGKKYDKNTIWSVIKRYGQFQEDYDEAIIRQGVQNDNS